MSATLLSAGVLLTDPHLDNLPVVPLPTLTARFARGLSDRVDLRLRYDSVAMFTHRFGFEVRTRLWSAGGWSLALGVAPSVQRYLLPYRGIFIGGDASTRVTALVTRRWSSLAVTLDVGPSVQWMVFGQSAGDTMVDSRPHLAYLDLGARLEWSRGQGRTTVLGLEFCVPLDRDDPLSFHGVLPRVSLGWSWSL
ncbi:MAG: hypothetical protein JWM10_1889 [Myxococcaceae bacterium]|nr:hypothetical protein [Myxococcaceae bacterium]